jgi:hypothetical protein
VITGEDLLAMGYPQGKVIGLALQGVEQAYKEGYTDHDLRIDLHILFAIPEENTASPLWSEAAKELIRLRAPEPPPEELCQ